MSYREFMDQTITPYIAARRTVRRLTMRDGKQLYGESYSADGARGTVFVLHGFTENAVKYSEIIYRFLSDGLSVFIYEQRGHGRSYRKVADKTLTHIDRFEEYVEDFETVLDSAADMPKPYYLFSHSMGGAVSALFMEKHPGVFKKAVLSSPMIAPTHGDMPIFIPKLICRFCIATFRKHKRIFVSKPYPGKEEFATSCATSEEKFAYYEEIKRKNEDFHNYSATYGWLLQSLLVTKKILAKGAPERIDVPVLILSAELDNVVLADKQQEFASRLARCRIETVKGAKHEVFLSPDEVTTPYFNKITEFFKA